VLALVLVGSALAAGIHLDCTTFTLDNGLRVVLHDDHRAPLVTVTWRVLAGSGDDPPGFSGTAHLLEHLLFEGSAHVPRGAFDARIAEVGGQSNGWTAQDATSYQVLVPAGALDLALYLESDRQASPLFDPVAFENEVGTLALEVERRADRAHGVDSDVLLGLVYPPGHPYASPITGHARDWVNLTGNDTAIRVFFRERYTPDRAVLVIAGDIDPTAAEALVRERFSGAPRREPAPRPAAMGSPRTEEERRVLVSPVSEGALYVAWRTVPRDHPDAPALALANWLFTTEEGRLDARFSDEVQVEGWSDAGRVDGDWGVRIADDGDLDRALRSVDQALRRFAARGPTEDELARARAAWEGAWIRALDSLPRRAMAIADCMEEYGHPDCLSEDLAWYAAVQASDVRRVVETWLDPSSRVVLSVVDRRSRAVRGSVPLGDTP